MKHGNTTHGMSGSPEYIAWQNLKARCNNPNYEDYHNYGGRGIKVCERYSKSFVEFFKDMGARPVELSLDRKNYDMNYSCGQCEECQREGWDFNLRWVDDSTQQRNRRKMEGCSSQYKGVCWNKRNKKWQANIRINGKLKNLGLFTEEIEAARAYETALRSLPERAEKQNLGETAN